MPFQKTGSTETPAELAIAGPVVFSVDRQTPVRTGQTASLPCPRNEARDHTSCSGPARRVTNSVPLPQAWEVIQSWTPRLTGLQAEDNWPASHPPCGGQSPVASSYTRHWSTKGTLSVTTHELPPALVCAEACSSVSSRAIWSDKF